MNERLEWSPSLKDKLKHSICGCFRHEYDELPSDEGWQQRNNDSRMSRSSSSGMRSSRSEEFLNLKHKCRSLMSRMGTPRGHHRKSQSTDFGYDPHSYSLNFDEDDTLIDDYPYRNFSARLPASPPRRQQQPPPRSNSDGALDKAAHNNNDETLPLAPAPPPRIITAYS